MDGSDAARTQDGVLWSSAAPIWNVSSPSGYSTPGTSSPALYGGSSTPVIDFAFPVYMGDVQQPDDTTTQSTLGYNLKLGQFNCDFSTPQLLPNQCFFWDNATSSCYDAYTGPNNQGDLMGFDEGYLQSGGTPAGPWSPVWAGNNGMELRAIAQGNPLNNSEPPFFYSINEGSMQCEFSPVVSPTCPPSSYENDDAYVTNNGGAGVFDPGSGTAFIANTCAPFDENGHYCTGPQIDDEGGVDPMLSVYDVTNRNQIGSGNWSPVAPAMTFYSNRIWIAMCAGWGCGGGITVGSVYPAQLTGCIYTASNIYVPGSAITATGAVSDYKKNGGCIWAAYPSATFPAGWGTFAANGSGSGAYSFTVTENNSGVPQIFNNAVIVADNKKVTIYQGTLGGAPGSGYVTIDGGPQEETINECPGNPYGDCWDTVWESGMVSLTVNGEIYSVSYGGPSDTSSELATTLANDINSQPPDSAVSATVSGGTIYITSNINGDNTNYSLSTTNTYASGFSSPAFTAYASGSSLTGGIN